MKTKISDKQRAGRRAGERGAAVLVVLVLLACMAVLIVENSRVLDTLQRELKLVEHKQLKKFERGPAAAARPAEAPGQKGK